jgi:hypothetical protein
VTFSNGLLGSIIEMQKKNDWPFAENGIAAGARGGYRTAVRIHMPSSGGELEGPWSKCHVLLQASPKAQLNHFFRLEWNPAKTGPAAAKRIADTLEVFSPGFDYDHVLKYGRITRLDMAADLKGVILDDNLWEAPNKQCRVLYVHRGELSTLYLGKKKGNSVAIYDKRRELGLPASTPPWTRVEARLKPQRLICDLPSLPNPFTRISVYDVLEAGLPLPTADIRAFLDSCQKRGLRDAVRFRSSADRAEFTSIVRAARPDWWEPKTLWETWEELLLAALSH